MDVFYLLIGILIVIGLFILVITVIKTICQNVKQKKNAETLEKGKNDYLNKIVPGSIFKHVITYDNPFFEDDCFYAIVVDIRKNKKGVKYVKYKALYKDILNEGWRFGIIDYDEIEMFVDYYDNETDLIYKDGKLIKNC